MFDETIITTNYQAREFLNIPTLNSRAFPLHDPRAHNTHFISGRKGYGKTTLIKEIINNTRFGLTIVFDWNSEYCEIKKAQTVLDCQELGERIEADTASSFFTAKTSTRLIYNLIPNTTGVFKNEVINCVDILARQKYVNGLLLIIEEANFFLTPASIPEPFLILIQAGRHTRITSIFATQRPHLINRDVTAQAESVTVFKTTEQRDLAYFAGFGFDPAELQGLKRGDCIIRHP